jgi:hypothetical protein
MENADQPKETPKDELVTVDDIKRVEAEVTAFVKRCKVKKDGPGPRVQQMVVSDIEKALWLLHKVVKIQNEEHAESS